MTDEWAMTTNIKAISAALAKAQAELKNPHMDSKNPHFKSKFASLLSVRNVVLPTLNKHGISVVQELTTTDRGVGCMVHLLHESGESLRFGPLVMPASKSDAHGFGSAATYARRYSLMAVAGVVGDEDDDGNSAVESGRKEADKAAQLRRKHLDSVTFIKDALDEDRLDDAALAWFELPDEVKSALWIAPTKVAEIDPELDGMLFSTKHREIMKSSEFR